MMLYRFVSLTSITTLTAFACTLTIPIKYIKAATLNAGDVVFSQDGGGSGANNAVLKADPVTGNRTLISQTGVLGTGPDFGSLIGGLTLDPVGNILLACFDAGTVMKIDVGTGNRTVVSSNLVGTGPSIQNINDLVVAPNGDIYATAQNINSIVRIDPVTGNRTVVSGPGVGTGTGFSAAVGLTRTPAGDFYVYDANVETVTLINGTNGNRTVISGGGVGGGPVFGEFGTDVELATAGFLATTNLHEIYRVDIATGNRSILSDAVIGTGPVIDRPTFLTKAADGSLIVAEIHGIYKVDPATGNRTVLTSTTFGTGPDVGLYREAVVVVSEPQSGAIAAVCVLIWLGKRMVRSSSQRDVGRN
jgi:hypothetical protein